MSKPVSEWGTSLPRRPLGDEPQVAGQLAHSPLVELLAYAFNQRFTGMLRLERRVEEALTIVFDAGKPQAADAAEFNLACQRRTLEEYLPPDAIRFAEQHGKAQSVDLLTATEQLLLLPTDYHAQVRSSFLREQLFAMCSVPPDTQFRFLAGGAPGPQKPQVVGLEPLGLIVDCILRESALERARRSVQAFGNEPLTMTNELPVELEGLDALCRQWVRRLSSAPTSYAQLARGLATHGDKLTALIYALLLTGHVVVRSRASERSAPMHQSRVPRTISSQALRVPPAARQPKLKTPAALSPTLPQTRRVSASEMAPRPSGIAPDGARLPPPGQLPTFDPKASGVPSLPPMRSSGAPVDSTRAAQGSGFWKRASDDAASAAGSSASSKPGSLRGGYAVAAPSSSPGAQSSSRPSSGPSSSAPLSPRTETARELAAEAKVVQAWMLGEADRTYLDKSRVFVAKVVRLYPGNARVRFCYASLLKRANKLDAAIQEFARVVELDPSHADAQQELDSLLKQRRGRRRR